MASTTNQWSTTLHMPSIGSKTITYKKKQDEAVEDVAGCIRSIVNSLHPKKSWQYIGQHGHALLKKTFQNVCAKISVMAHTKWTV